MRLTAFVTELTDIGARAVPGAGALPMYLMPVKVDNLVGFVDTRVWNAQRTYKSNDASCGGAAEPGA